jgi:hypothetical protein
MALVLFLLTPSWTCVQAPCSDGGHVTKFCLMDVSHLRPGRSEISHPRQDGGDGKDLAWGRSLEMGQAQAPEWQRRPIPPWLHCTVVSISRNLC